MLATVLIMLTYLVPVLVTTALDPDWEAYKDGHYTEVAHALPVTRIQWLAMQVATSTAGVGLTVTFLPISPRSSTIIMLLHCLLLNQSLL